MGGRVWITGGGGMVGRALQESFGRLRPDVRVVAPSSSELDLTRREDVDAFVRDTAPDVVVHAAGKVGGIAANIANPVEFLVANMAIGMNVIEASRRAGVTDLVNISSSCMYPKDHDGLLTEDLVLAGPLEPTNEGYALAKIAADRLCEYVAREDGLRYRTVIPSNLYGPGDHFDEHRGHLIANVIRKIHAAKAAGAEVVEVWGDGTARREFTYVNDVTDYIATVARAEALDDLPQRLNVGIGRDYTVREYYDAVAAVVGYDGRFEYDLSKPSGMKRKLMDSSVAHGHGWSPATNLEQGLERTYQSFLTSTNEVDIAAR